MAPSKRLTLLCVCGRRAIVLKCRLKKIGEGLSIKLTICHHFYRNVWCQIWMEIWNYKAIFLVTNTGPFNSIYYYVRPKSYKKTKWDIIYFKLYKLAYQKINVNEKRSDDNIRWSSNLLWKDETWGYQVGVVSRQMNQIWHSQTQASCNLGVLDETCHFAIRENYSLCYWRH